MGNVNGIPSEEETQPPPPPLFNTDNGIIDLPMIIPHSPPTSPRSATHSPLIFTPQLPVSPLQIPDEMHHHPIPPTTLSSSSTQTTTSTYPHQIPTLITWTYGGQQISLEGSWDNWKSRIPLQKSGKDFAIIKVLPSGVYHYRFIVDGRCTHAPDLPWSQDEAGNAYNILDLQDYVPEDIGSISGFEPPQSPPSSYDNLQLSSEDFAKEPPLVPPHFAKTLLNVRTTNMEIQPPLPRPQHGVLNHLYMQKGKSSPSVVALGTTHRYLDKYVTVVLYKSLQR